MNARVMRALGLTATAVYAAFIVWVYVKQPHTIAQVTGGIASTIGAYHVDYANFEEGLRFFRNNQFPESRAAFARADPAEQDARTQLYIAYSYYRQGWGRMCNDDELFRKGLEVVNRSVAVAPDHRVVVNDPTLGLPSADELKAELERGLTHDISDLNPLKVFRKRQ